MALAQSWCWWQSRGRICGANWIDEDGPDGDEKERRRRGGRGGTATRSELDEEVVKLKMPVRCKRISPDVEVGL